MDLEFARLGAMRRSAVPARLDYPGLVAGITALQAVTPTAAMAARLAASQGACDSPGEALVILLAAKPGWTAAVASLGGSFHPEAAQVVATSRRKAS